MIMRLHDATRQPFVILAMALAIAAATLVTLLAILPIISGGEPAGRDQGGKGGGGEPRPELVAAFNSLPLYPGAVSEDAKLESSEGTDVWDIYFVQDPPEEVNAFYEQALPAQGWAVNGPAVSQGGTKDREQAMAITRSFGKGNLQVTISVAANTKDPSRGATQLSVAVKLRTPAGTP